MLKRICCIFALLLLLTASVSASDDNRWHWIDSDSTQSFYIDMNTLQYDSGTNIAYCWIKTVKAFDVEGLYKMDRRKIDYNTKKIEYLEEASFKDGSLCARHEYSYVGQEMFEALRKSFIPPESTDEKIADFISDKYGIPRIYPVHSSTRWIWLRSTDTYSLYIGNDSMQYDPERQTYWFWILLKKTDGKRSYASDRFNFLDHTKGSNMYTPLNWVVKRTAYILIPDARMTTPVPESDDEKEYDTAYKIFCGPQK